MSSYVKSFCSYPQASILLRTGKNYYYLHFQMKKLRSGEWDDVPRVIQLSPGTDGTEILIWNSKFLVLCSLHGTELPLPSPTQIHTHTHIHVGTCTHTPMQVKSRVSNLFQNKSKSYLCFSVFRQREAIAWISVIAEVYKWEMISFPR